jgi:hypothetical protein
MAHAFAPIPAKPTFGTFRKNLYQSDYINRKKAKLIYCNSKDTCGKILVAADYKERALFKTGRDAINLLRCSNAVIPINKANLIMGQYTKLDLNRVCTVLNTTNYSASDCLKHINDTDINIINGCPNNSPVIIDPSSTTPFYQSNIIDPCGYLFGNSQCGELNYTSYMVFYPPTVSPII